MRIKVNSLWLNYELTGSGDCLTLIHGLAENLKVWRNQIATFAPHYQVLAWDVRGHGQSDIPEGDYTVELLAHDLYLLLQKLEIDSTFLLGFSMGGVVAQKFALDYPQKTRGLIILGSSSECNAAAAAWYQERASLAEERGMEAVVEGDTERCFTSAFKMNQPTIVAEYQRMRAQTDPRGYARVARAMASLYQHPLTPELGRITCPTLILVGEEDIACPPGASVIMHRRIPGSQLRIIKGWPHQVLIEAPQELNTAVLEFLAAVSQKRA